MFIINFFLTHNFHFQTICFLIGIRPHAILFFLSNSVSVKNILSGIYIWQTFTSADARKDRTILHIDEKCN